MIGKSEKGYITKNSLIHSVLIFLILFGRLNGYLYDNTMVFIVLVCLALFGVLLLGRIDKRSLNYVVWQLAFLSIYIISISWAYDSNITWINFRATVARTIPIIYIAFYITSDRRLISVIKNYNSVVVLNALIIIFVYGLDTLVRVRQIEVSISGGWNCNSIGIMMAFAIFLNIFLLVRKKTVIRNLKWYYYLSILLELIVLLYSGSKKAIFIIVFACMFYYFLSSRNKLRSILLIACSIPILYNLLISIPFLYDLIGNRIQQLFVGMMGEGVLNASDRVRQLMITSGIEWFKESPWLGWGMANFKSLYNDMYGVLFYAHNNYIEILVGMGIFGFIVYYAGYLYVFLKAYKMKNTDWGKLALVLMVTIMIAEYGLVSYLFMQAQLMICLCFYIVQYHSLNIIRKSK